MRQHRRFVLLGSILLFSQSLAHVGQQRPRVICLAVLPLAISLLLAFIPIASPAFAATNSHTKLVTSTVLTTSRNSAGNPCATRQSDETLTDGFGNVQIWLRMKTTYCWNYSIVTYHSTYLYWGVTTLGVLVGWTWLYNPDYAFNCYVASGSSRNCSGNHEHAKEVFLQGPVRFETDLIVDQNENYKGQFFSHGSRINCPGGC